MQKEIILEQIPLSQDSTFVYRHDHLQTEDELGYHSHPEFELEFVKKGSGVHVIGGITETCVEGEIFLIPGNLPHSWFWDNSAPDREDQQRIEEYTVQFQPQFIRKLMVHFPEMEECAIFYNQLTHAIEIKGETAESIRQLLIGMQQQSPAHRLLSFLYILTEISTCKDVRIISLAPTEWSTPRRAERIDKVYKFILENYTRPVSLDEIADVACMNKSAFCIFFKKMTGKTFANLMNEYRVNKACLLLTNSSLSVNEICFACGFNDVSHFTKVFKQLKGCPPGKYR